MINPNEIFEDLRNQATKQQAKSLSILNDVLKAHCEAGKRDFSIAEIARRSMAAGGPSTSTIRNKGGLRFRQLIEAWASSVGSGMKMPAKSTAKGQKVPSDNELVRLIDDVALRSTFTQILAERNRYLNELNILKSQKNTIVDRRPSAQVESSKEASVQVISSLSGLLKEHDIAALQAAVSDKFFSRQGWQVTLAGQVKGEDGEIYKRGYVTAIKKILAEVGQGD